MGVVGAGAVVASTAALPTLAKAEDSAGRTEPADAPYPSPGFHPDNPAAPGAAVATLLAAAPIGTRLGALCVAATFDVFRGAVPLLLEDASGRRVQLDILAASTEGPAPIASAGGLAVFVADGAQGDAPAHPEVLRAARALVAVLGPAPRDLLDHATRTARHGGEVLSVKDNPLR